MPITYGMNLAKSWGELRSSGTVLMKAYTTHTEQSEVFLSYKHADQSTALGLANELDQKGRWVFIDVHDDTLMPGHRDLDDALVIAISKADTMIVIVSDETQWSWWVPWEIGVSTPSRKPKAMYKPQTNKSLPTYLEKLPRLRNSSDANLWIVAHRKLRRPGSGDSR